MPSPNQATGDRRGSVYILTNPAMPGLVKVGCTGDTPEARAAKLTQSTGVPLPFVVAWARPVTDWHAVEQLTHDLLTNRRVNDKREFFRCPVKQARKAIKRSARAYLRPWWWKLLFGRRRRPAARDSRDRKGYVRTPWLLIGGIAGALAVFLIVHFKPAVPSFLPDPIKHTAHLIEGEPR